MSAAVMDFLVKRSYGKKEAVAYMKEENENGTSRVCSMTTCAVNQRREMMTWMRGV